MRRSKPRNESGTRNSFEQSILENCDFGNIEYESEKINYQILEDHQYIPDFVIRKLDGSKIYVEAKGYLRPTDMKKMKAVKASNPYLDIRFVFQKDNKVPKARKMTYSQWAERNGFKWALGLIPLEWCR